MRWLVLVVLLALLALVDATHVKTPQLVYKRHLFRPISVQTLVSHQPATTNSNGLRNVVGWSLPIRTTLPGTLTSEVKENRAQYEANSAPLVRQTLLNLALREVLSNRLVPLPKYLIPTPNSTTSNKIECVRGNGWFGVTPNTPLTSLCLPWSCWPVGLLRLAKAIPTPGELQCSFPSVLQNYPHCGLGYHCDTSIGKCELTTTYKAVQDGACPDNSGLVWSKSKKRCVQCLASSIRLPSRTSSVAHVDYYRTGFVCDSDGNAVPPLAVALAFQLYTEPKSFLHMCIFITVILSTILYATLSLSKRVKRFRYKKHS